MEQHQIVDAMTGLKLSRMRKGQARREELHPGLKFLAATARIDAERARLWHATHTGLES